MSLPSVESLIDKLAEALTPCFTHPDSQPVIVGIETGGVWIAEQLRQRLAPNAELGRLDISFYRDDFTRKGLQPEVKPSSLPTAIDDRDILLVDDVLQSGRTVRAAMNELFDYGRPSKILLAILIDRGQREIPVQADFVGETLSLDSDSHIKLTGPEPLALELKTLEQYGGG